MASIRYPPHVWPTPAHNPRRMRMDRRYGIAEAGTFVRSSRALARKVTVLSRNGMSTEVMEHQMGPSTSGQFGALTPHSVLQLANICYPVDSGNPNRLRSVRRKVG